MKPDPPYERLINDKNRSDQGGALVTEIIPADQATVKAAKPGEHVLVTGPYVLDRQHGWMEIHPVWQMESLR
ncbi:MAG TPA: hypothetical protein VGK74_13970 [Symbiobacteriaceae bacterium]